MSHELTRKDVKHFDGKLRKILGLAVDTGEQIEAESLDRGEGGLDLQGGEGADQEFEEVDLDALEIENSEAQAAVDALKRISDGTYGRCTECNAWIPRGRLEAVPYTSHCVTCQEALEEKTA